MGVPIGEGAHAVITNGVKSYLIIIFYSLGILIQKRPGKSYTCSKI